MLIQIGRFSNMLKAFKLLSFKPLLVIILFIVYSTTNISMLYAYTFSGKVDYGIGAFKKQDFSEKNSNTQEYNQASIYSVMFDLSMKHTPIVPEIELSRIIVDTTKMLQGDTINILSILQSNIGNYNINNNLSINVGFINATINLIDSFFTPYIGFGIGKGVMNNDALKDIEKNFIQAIAGANLELNHNISLDLRYKILSTFLRPDFSIVNDANKENENKASFLSLEKNPLISNFLTLGIQIKF